MPCEQGEYGRISPNTGVTKFSLSLGPAGGIEGVQCTMLYYKDHLQGMDFHEPVHYGV